MGSLTSRPSIPQVQQPVVYTIPAYYPSASSAPPPSATPAAATTPAQTAPAVNSESGEQSSEAQRLAREDNLLRRSRGRLGTVLTGFSGLLSDTVSGARKTLLGE